NGKMLPFAEANTHVTAFTLHYGVAAFEGIRCYKRNDGRSAVFRLREHVERLIYSAKICDMVIPYSRDQIEAACLETLRANKLVEAYIRPLVYLGPGALGLGSRDNPVDLIVIAFPWGAYLGADAINRGIRVHVSTYVRGHLNQTMSKAKISGQYVNSVLAKREVVGMGYDEAIMLDADGRVAEGTGENIFMVYRGRLYTPPLSMPILDGITRDAVLTLARENGVEVVEQTFTRDMLYASSEVFFTGTACEVTPVREIDKIAIGTGEPGPVTRKLQAAFAAVVKGATDAHPELLAFL
ncbi:MAG TPA: branched-chain amino acid transaminase, partial [Polyangia bacterium]